MWRAALQGARALACALGMTLVSCGDEASPVPDAGEVADAAAVDAGPVDAAVGDAAIADAEVADAEVADAEVADAEVADAGVVATCESLAAGSAGQPTTAVTAGGHRCTAGRLERRQPDGSWVTLGSCVAAETRCHVEGFHWTPVPLMHWTGSAMGPGSVCLPFAPIAILGTATDDVWLLVDAYDGVTSTRAALWHWDGVAWAEAFVFEGMVGRGLERGACGGLWVAGEWRPPYAELAALLRWDGATWRDLTPPMVDDGHVDALREAAADGALWAVGSGGAWRWTEAGWSAVPGEARELTAIWAASADDAWLVAEGLVLLRWDGAAFAEWSFPADAAGLYSLFLTGFAADDVWTNGFLHWDGSAWTRTAAPEVPIAYFRVDPTTVLAIEPKEGCYFPSSTTVWRFDGSVWQLDASGLGDALPPDAPYGLIWGSSEADLWLAQAPPDSAC
jgi:hypothetical protein